jgi:alpha-beta hydrolase superfamily lysophospholipase
VRSAPFALRASDGARLRVERWLPEHAPRAWLQIVHGMGEHARRYARLAERACAEGIAVAAHDQRGHGQSALPGALGDLGADGWRAAVRDVGEVADALLAEAPVPRILLGHSMGSFVARAALPGAGAALAGCALSGSGVPPRCVARLGAAIASFEALRLGAGRPSPLLHRLAFGRAERAIAERRTPFDWLSRDRAEVDAYCADPLCGFELEPRSLAAMFRGLAALERARDLRRVPRSLPLYAFSGSDDPVSGALAVEALTGRYHRAGFTRVSSRIYPGDRHETLNELDRQQVERDLLDWISTCLEPAGR